MIDENDTAPDYTNGNTCNACEAQIKHLRGNFKTHCLFVDEMDRRLIRVEADYKHINDYLGKIDVRVDSLDNKMDGLKDLVVEKKIAKQLKGKIKMVIYNGTMLVIGLIGIYGIIFEHFDLK